MSEESVVVFLRAQIGEFSAKMKEAGAETEAMGRRGEGSFARFQSFGSAALLAVGIAALAVGVYGVKMADEFEGAHARLETAIKNTGGNFDELKGKVGQTDKQLESLGFTNAVTESALATLTGAVHSGEKAMSLMGLAADIARGRHIDLASATNILVKVETGHVGLLGKLGINTKDATGATISQEEAIKRLTGLYGGQAKAYTETFAGKIEVLKTKGEDLAKNIGLMLIPIIEQLATTLMGVVTFIQDANDATGGWIGKLALFSAGGALAVIMALKLWSGIGALASMLGAAGAAFARFTIEVIGFAAANPEIAILMGLTAAVTAFGLASQETSTKVSTLTNQDLADLAMHLSQVSSAGGMPSATFAMQAFKQALSEGIPQAERWIEAEKKYGLATADQQKILDHATQAQKDSTAATTKDTSAKTLSAAQMKANAAAAKAMSTELANLGKIAGGQAVEVAKASGLSVDAIKAEIAAVKQMDSAFTSSFDSSIDVLSKFKDKSHVSFQSFIDDEYKALTATANWSSNIAQLADDHINHGFLETLIKAGPAEAGLVQSILDNVKHGSIQTINLLQGAADSIKTKTMQHLNDVETGVAAFSRYINSQNINLKFMINGKPIPINSTGDPILGALVGRVGPHAAGGTIGPGEFGTVGEQGTELAYGLPGGGVQIFPHGQSKAMVGGGSARGASVAVRYGDVHLHDVGSMSPAEIERAVVAAMRHNTAELVHGIEGWQRAGNGLLVDKLARAK